MNDTHKWVAVIGASRGIGLSAVKALASQGFAVIGTARDDSGEEAVTAAGGICIRMDLRLSDSLEEGIELIQMTTGGYLHAVVLNAGVGQPGAIEDVPLNAWRDTFEVNLFGQVAALQGLMPLLRRSSGSRVIWVGSVLGMMGLGFRGVYVATKFAIEGVADVLRIELASAGVHVSVIQPGPVATDFRRTARKRFDSVDRGVSQHSAEYLPFVNRLEMNDVVSGDTVHADTAARAILQAVIAQKPRARYKVCRSTWGVAVMRRLTPRLFVTWIGIRAFKSETRGK